jgi:hypothetical protein
MAKEVYETTQDAVAVAGEACDRPTRGWLRRKVDKIAKRCLLRLSQTAKRKLQSLVMESIVRQDMDWMGRRLPRAVQESESSIVRKTIRGINLIRVMTNCLLRTHTT